MQEQAELLPILALGTKFCASRMNDVASLKTACYRVLERAAFGEPNHIGHRAGSNDPDLRR